MMDTLLLYIVMIIHFLVIFFVVFVPFIGNNYLLLVHSIIVPFIMIHWITNNNSCALTMIELNLRSKIEGIHVDKKNCFTCRIINPIYDVTNNYNEYSTLIYIVTILLWLTSSGKLIQKYCSGEIKSYEDVLTVKHPLLKFY